MRPQAGSGDELTNASVLIVDEDASVRRALDLVLTHLGYDVSLAPDSRAGMRAAEQCSPAVVLVSALNGRDYCPSIGTRPDSRLPVMVFMGSGDGPDHQAQSCTPAWLPKPIDLDRLLSIISAGGNPDVDRAGQLLARIGDTRDPEALAQLYTLCGPAALRLATAILSDRWLAEDAVQDAFFNIWRNASTYNRSKSSGRRWVLAVVQHQSIDKLRRVRSRTRLNQPLDGLMPDIAADDLDVANQALANLQRRTVISALDTLPLAQRRVLALAYFSGYTHAQIARLLEVPLGTVKGRLRLGLDKLRLNLDHQI